MLNPLKKKKKKKGKHLATPLSDSIAQYILAPALHETNFGGDGGVGGVWSPPPPLLLEEVEHFCEKLQGFFGVSGEKSSIFLRNYVKESEVCGKGEGEGGG